MVLRAPNGTAWRPCSALFGATRVPRRDATPGAERRISSIVADLVQWLRHRRPFAPQVASSTQATDAAGLGRNHRPRGSADLEGLPYPDWLPNWWNWAIPFAVPLVAWDLATIRRLHPATLIGVPVFVLLFPFVLWVRTTPWWMHMITTLIS